MCYWWNRIGEIMLRQSPRLLILVLTILLVAPVLAYPDGPPWKNGSDLVVESGCSCHGDGAPSTEVVVSISGVPRSYEVNKLYNFTITLQHATNLEGGYMLWDYNMGNLTPGEGSIAVAEEPGAISQGQVGNNWEVYWTSPDSDVGEIPFQLVGNAVNGNGEFDSGDLWNILSFSISSPGSTYIDDNSSLQVRTISVGDYESLFVVKDNPEALESARQEEIADGFFSNGNLFYWTTLSIIIVGAVIQGEFYERKFGGGPPHLDMRLAVPQGLRRGALAAGLAMLFAWSIDSTQSWGVILLCLMVFLWSMFGVYRTIVQAKSPKQYMDVV